MHELELQLFGGVRGRDGNGESLQLTSRKATALLAYVAAAEDLSARRGRLAGMLWEDSAPEQARGSLRQALYVLRNALPDGVIEAEGEEVSLLPDAVWVDVRAFERKLGAGSTDSSSSALELYAGDFLEGFDPGAPAFEEWQLNNRRWYREQALRAAETIAGQYEDAQRFSDAISAVMQWLELDSTHEAAHRQLMRLYARLGRRGDALRQYRRCRQVLEQQLEVTPSPETDNLHRDIIEGEIGGSAGTAGHASLEEPSDAWSLEPQDERAVLRQVAVVHVLLDDAGADPQASARALSSCIDRVQDVLDDYACTDVREVGHSVVAVFGVPQARSRDIELSVRAALDIREATGECAGQVESRIGVATGQGVYRQGGGRRRVIGPPLGRASELKSAAEPGQVLIGRNVRHALPAELQCRRTKSAGTGREDAWELVRGADMGVEEPVFAGRRFELGQVDACLDVCLDQDRGRSLLVVGEAGIGKSRLAREVSALATERGFAIHRAGALDVGVGNGDHATRQLALSLLGLDDESSEAARESAVERASDSELRDAEQVRFCRDLIGLPRSDDESALFEAMGVYARNAGRCETLCELLRASARREPVLVILEDLHWMGLRAVECMQRVIQTVRDCSAVLLMTTRPDGNPFDVEGYGLPTSASVLHLGPLHDRDAATVAGSFSETDQAHRQRCIERADGNPLFLIQLLRCTDDGAHVPDTIRSIVLATVDSLPYTQQRVLRAASVLGQRVDPGSLCGVLERENVEYQVLTERDLLREEGDELVFSHALTRDAVYSSILDEDRRRWHGRAAELYEDGSVLRAEHLERAGDAAAADAFVLAARAHVDAYEYDQALELAERGLQQDPTEDTRFELEMLRAEQLYYLGKPRACVDAYEQSIEIASSAAERARAWTGKAAGLRILEQHDQVVEALDHAERAAEQSQRDDLLAPIYYHRGNMCFLQGRIDGCIEAHETALELARSHGLDRDEVKALSGLGDAHYLRGRMRSAHDSFERCISLARERGFGRLEVANLHMRGLTFLYQCDSDEAARVCEDAVSRARAVGNRRAEMVALNSLCDIRAFRADFDALEEAASACVDLAEQLGATRFAALSRGYRGWGLAQRGRREQGVALIEEGLQASRREGMAFAGPNLLGLLATATDDAGETNRALEDGRQFLREDAASHNHLLFYPLGILARFEQGDAEGIGEFADSLRDYTSEEPLAWTSFFCDCADLLERVADGEVGDALLDELDAFAQEARDSGLQLVLPVLDACRAHASAPSGETSHT